MYSGFWVLGALQHRGLFYHKSVGIRDLFGNIEGGALPGPKRGQNTNEEKNRIHKSRKDLQTVYIYCLFLLYLLFIFVFGLVSLSTYLFVSLWGQLAGVRRVRVRAPQRIGPRNAQDLGVCGRLTMLTFGRYFVLKISVLTWAP